MKRILLLISALFLVFVGLEAQSAKGAVISTTEIDYDFGIIKEAAGKVSHVFTLQNKGDKPLVISRVVAACGCTTPEYSNEPIAPGAQGRLKVIFDPKGRPGPFVKTVAVYSNGRDGAYTVRIKGVVE